MALSRNRIIGNLASAIDSASQNSFLSKASQDGEYKSLAYSDLSGAPTVLDSAGISAVIDSSYTQLRITPATGPTKSVDSAVVTSLIDSNYVTNRAPAASNTGFTTYNYTATAGQTTFQDSDLSGNILSYTAGGTMVWMNGVMLKETADWTGTDGSSIVLDSAANAGAKITIAKWNVLAGGGAGGASISWGGDRGVLGGGSTLSYAFTNSIEYWDITTPGNATDFGDMTLTVTANGGTGDGTYALFSGGLYFNGSSNVKTNTIDYVTIATTGNASDFGDMTRAATSIAGLTDGTYGLFGGGNDTANSNIIEYVTIASPGNATDFGDLTTASIDKAAINNATTGLFAGGFASSSINVIEYVTIASPGNASDFGDLTIAKEGPTGVEDTTRGVFCGGYDAGGYSNTMEYVTVATPGNASDFGDLGYSTTYSTGASNGTYGTITGGQNLGIAAALDNIEYIVIQTAGNATDFGDLIVAKARGGCSSGSPS